MSDLCLRLHYCRPFGDSSAVLDHQSSRANKAKVVHMGDCLNILYMSRLSYCPGKFLHVVVKPRKWRIERTFTQVIANRNNKALYRVHEHTSSFGGEADARNEAGTVGSRGRSMRRENAASRWRELCAITDQSSG
jgi:hypothetical protein